MGENVIAQHKVSSSPSRDHFFCRICSEEFDKSFDPFFLCRTSHIPGRLDTKNRNPLFHEVLQQIAIIARDLDDKTLLVQAKPSADSLCISPGVIKPTIRV